ncbi:penicillin-binding protein 2 [gamma proteobacterium HTCC5015]|nr:penicillin-binding protein 2 [gamma proteobacterium HTCC5015]
MARRRARLRNPDMEIRLFKGRALFAGVVCLLLAATLFGRLAWLQFFQYDNYQEQSQDNRVRVRPIPPTRGLIFDRNGQLLADNRPSYQLEITPELVEDMDALLAQLESVVSISDQERTRFKQGLYRQRRGSYKGVPLKFNLAPEQLAAIAVDLHRYPGVSIEARLNRFYPDHGTAVHTVGYVGRVDERDLERLEKRAYQGTTHTGKAGIERHYEDLLHGEVGFEQVEVNVQGRALRVLDQQKPEPGANLYLSLDLGMQRVAERAFGEEAGALVAMDPRTGEILAMASMPTYDPNSFVNGISVKDYAALRDGFYRPLFNRALTGQYPPGSTVKPFYGLGALEEGVNTQGKKIRCIGYYQLPNEDHRYRCWKKHGHGRLDLDQSIAQSCDIFFYDLAHRMGIQKMHDYLAPFGFGRELGIDTLGEEGGLLPSPEWKRRARNRPWYPGETLIAGIGQGYFLATPLQLAVATSALAMDGAVPKPHLLQRVEHADGRVEHHSTEPMGQVEVKQQRHWEYIKKSMEHVVHHRRGTAYWNVGVNSEYRFAGKTGTAQVFSVAQDEEYDEELVEKRLRDHALFVSWAPVDDPQIVVAVIVENGGHGSSVAAPIAKQVMDYHLLGEAP